MKTNDLQQATFAGGCFWCIEAPLQRLKGVGKVISGYMGGSINNPSYQQICSGMSGHAEVVQLNFDADVISYRELLQIFFSLHDPTQLNRQGNDCGSQYRSAIFYHDQQQQQLAEQAIATLNNAKIWPNPIVTSLEALQPLFIAEQHHQNFYDNNPNQPYCQIMIEPKLLKLQQLFPDKLL